MGVPSVEVAFLPVLVAAIVQMILGALWYSPALFGNIWMKLSGINPAKMGKIKKGSAMRSCAFGFVAALLTVYVLAHFVKYIAAATFADGLALGFWIWLGFVAPIQLGMILWEGKSVKLYILNTGYYLVALMLTAGILSVWN